MASIGQSPKLSPEPPIQAYEDKYLDSAHCRLLHTLLGPVLRPLFANKRSRDPHCHLLISLMRMAAYAWDMKDGASVLLNISGVLLY